MKKAEKKPDPGSLRVLILEDNPADAELVEHELRRAKIAFTSLIVEGKRAFSKALADFQPQVILSDFKLPEFDGQAALAVARLQAPDIPFIFVSGSIGEEKAIELLSQGASDYIFKDNLQRLGPAVRRVIETARLKLEKKNSEEELQLLAQAADRFLHINDLDRLYDYLTQAIRAISGADYLLLSLYDEERQGLQPKVLEGIAPFQELLLRKLGRAPEETILLLKDMSPAEFADFVSRKLLPIHAGLFTLTDRTTPRSVCRVIEKTMGITALYAMGFSWENQLFGGLALAFKKGKELRNIPTIEALVNLAAVAIKRLLAEKSLRESEERFRRISATTSDISYSCISDAEGIHSLSWMTGAADSITGYTIEEILAMKCWEKLLLPDDLAGFEKYVTGLEPGNTGICELRLRHKNGSIVWVQSSAECIATAEGLTLYGGLVNINNRKRIETSLRESEQKNRTLVTQSPDGIFITDLQGKFLSVNPAMCAALHYTEAEFLSMKIGDIIPEQSADLNKQRLAAILKGEAKNEAAEYRVKGKEGETHYVDILSAPYFLDDMLIGIQGIARDVTEKKKMEILLRESEEYYRTLVDTSPDAIIIVDAGGRVTFCSDKTMDLFGIPPGTEIVGASIFDFVEPAEISRVQERMVEILSGRSLPEIREYRLQRQDRRPFWGEVSSAPLHDDKGRDIGLLMVCRDVSERKRSEAALSESEERYRLIADNTAETITVLDRDLRYTYISPSIFKLRGFTVEEALKQTLEETLTRDSLARIQDIFQEEMALEMSGTADPKRNRSLELQEFCKDGSIVWVENSLSFLRDSQGKPIGILAVSKDISERKQAEDLVRTSLREKEVLLQEVHHRVKNNLQIISGLLTLQADQAAGKPLDEIFRESQDRIRSIALIHEKLYRSHNLAEIAFDDYLRNLVENLFNSYCVDAGRITAAYDMEKFSFTIEKAIPLGLIVNELVTNALKHAFPGGRRGEIRISLQKRRGVKFYAPTDENRSPACELTIADNGVGLPAGFDTTRQKTLGMNLVFMLTNQLQAEIQVKTAPGSEFRLVFPATIDKSKAEDKPRPGGI